MRVDVYVDGSHMPHAKATAYAFWCVGPGDALQRARVCPEEIAHIGHAEIYGIFQALGAARQRWPEAHTIRIHTDSQHAITVLCENRKATTARRDKVLLRLKVAYNRLSEVRGCSVRLIKQQSKSQEGDTASIIHNWCDNAARVVLYEHIREKFKRDLLQRELAEELERKGVAFRLEMMQQNK